MSTLRVHVGGSFADTKRRALDAVERAKAGKRVRENHLTFASWDLFAATMTQKRLDLLRHVHRHPEASIASLARALGRDYKRVHDDVQALADAGLIDRSAGGVRAPYDEIQTAVVL